MFPLFFLIHNDLDLYPHKLYMANKKSFNEKWWWWMHIVWLTCLVDFFFMGVYIAHVTNFNEHKKSSLARIWYY